MKNKIMYLNGTWKCKILVEYPNGSFTYIPLEGVPKNQMGKTFNSCKDVYFLTDHPTPEPYIGGKLNDDFENKNLLTNPSVKDNPKESNQ